MRGSDVKKAFFLLVALYIAGVLVVGGAFLYWRQPILQTAGDLLVRDDRASLPSPADALVLLMGDDTGTRAETACHLYKQHAAQRIVFAEERRRGFVKLGLEPSGAEVHFRFLTSCGVPASDITVLSDCATDSTVDEARCIGDWATGPGQAKTLLLVTSWYHTSRAGWLFSHWLGDRGLKIAVAPAISADSTPVRWWDNKFSVLKVMHEYVKWTYWLIRWKGGLSPGS